MYGYGGNPWGTLIAILIGIIVLFLILREFWCWYWKINRLVALMEEQNKTLKDLLEKNGIQSNSST